MRLLLTARGHVHRPPSVWTSDTDTLLQLPGAGRGGNMGIIFAAQAVFGEVRGGVWGGEGLGLEGGHLGLGQRGSLDCWHCPMVHLKRSHKDCDRDDSAVHQLHIWIKEVKWSSFRVNAWLKANWVGPYYRTVTPLDPVCSAGSNWTRLDYVWMVMLWTL